MCTSDGGNLNQGPISELPYCCGDDGGGVKYRARVFSNPHDRIVVYAYRIPYVQGDFFNDLLFFSSLSPTNNVFAIR